MVSLQSGDEAHDLRTMFRTSGVEGLAAGKVQRMGSAAKKTPSGWE
jgi:hypothetical protein